MKKMLISAVLFFSSSFLYAEGGDGAGNGVTVEDSGVIEMLISVFEN